MIPSSLGNEKMNIEEQCLDLCNIKTKSNVDLDHNTANNTEEVTSQTSELTTDSNLEKQNTVPSEASETYLMPQLNDNLHAAEEGNQQALNTLEIDEANGNRHSSAQETPVVVNTTDLIFSTEEQHKSNIGSEQMKGHTDKFVLQDDGGEMDVGVDLSLDESGVLEGDSTNVRSLSDNSLDSEFVSQDIQVCNTAESPSDASQISCTEDSTTDKTGLYPSVEEGDDGHKPAGKRVTFPSDEDIVSGAVEPKDPWRHAHNVTVEEIISTYKQACQKLNCKPISKVLKQIQELKDLTQRNECLDLKGEKLDYKACESLEEILKRVQFKVIDLEQTNLDEDGASSLFDMIEYYESATHLNISFNKHIGTRGWQAAAHMMRKTSSLQYLDARNTPLLDNSAPFVARALRISGSLAVLHLENAGLSGRPLMLLATALKMNMNLRELYLADNKLNCLQDSAQLGNLLKFNYNIQILDLRNNHILDSGLAYVCEGLKEQRKGLVTLVLWNNQLTHNGMGYLAAALPCTQSLETLNLGHNSVGNEGVHKLKDGLIANRSVLRLGLASTKLSCEGAVAVAEFIAESPRLLRLDLRENEIKTGGLMALSLALKVNTSLLRLDLDREPKKETVKSFIETQRALLSEIQNGCKRNFILAKEKEETEQKMRLSASMAEIATEDGTREEEEQRAPEKKVCREGKEGDQSKTIKNEEQTTNQSEGGNEVTVPQINMESDSDTEDEEEEEVVTKSSFSSNSSNHLQQLAPQTQTEASQPLLSPALTSPSQTTPPSSGITIVSGITVTETTSSPSAPPSPGRCISVSSPGRGHKIFMVTRVESPPEQQQQQLPLQLSTSAAPSQADQTSKEPKDGAPPTAQQTQLPPPSLTPVQTQLTPEEVKQSSPPLSTDCKLTEQSSAETQPHTLDPQSASQPTDDVTASTLDLGGADPSRPAPGLPSDSPERTERPQPEPVRVEGKQGGGNEEGLRDDGGQVSTEGPGDLSQTQMSILVETQQQPLASALEQLESELASASEETLSRTNEEDEAPDPAPVSWAENEKPVFTETECQRPIQEESCPTEAEPPSVEAVLLVAQESNPPAGDSSSPRPASTVSVSPVKGEDSSDDSSTDDGECFTDAPEDVVGSALPNGLKQEFSLHLLDDSPKPGSCVMEHVSVSCGQELEELLLEASLETGRDAP
ncbi:protein phosphatase 1 regulatory subunit 37 [Antennarius striatus]|uniref:protein phosphatase 1 regulatory subunit 37 n=1 Tax=Antennarius striatus TaxID=241820 RepID=UPI0035B0D711